MAVRVNISRLDFAPFLDGFNNILNKILEKGETETLEGLSCLLKSEIPVSHFLALKRDKITPTQVKRN